MGHAHYVSVLQYNYIICKKNNLIILNSLDAFKNNLNKYWINQVMFYDYRKLDHNLVS